MSWSDRCSNCGQHRADCDCGDWNGYKKAEKEKNITGKFEKTIFWLMFIFLIPGLILLLILICK